MTICFVEIPPRYWSDKNDRNNLTALFRQLRLSEVRISNGINAAVERKRHHKICSVIESLTRKLVDEGNVNTAVEFPLEIENMGKIPSSSYLQFTELLMATTNPKLTSIGTNNGQLDGLRKLSLLSLLKRIVLYIIGLFSREKENISIRDETSINIPFNPTSPLQDNNHWLSRFSDTPSEVGSKLALFEELYSSSFEQYFGSIVGAEITGYKPMLHHLLQVYKSALKQNAGIIVVVNADVC